MRDWKIALEAGVNKAWGGTKPTGYSATVRLVALVAHIFDEAGFVVLPADSDVVPHIDGEVSP